MGLTYSQAGVDIEKGDRFARFIAALNSPAVSRGIGGFAGGVEIDTGKFRNPVMLSTTDGVGTKLMVAQKLGIYDTVGIDLVAMCVNDLIVCGAEPVSFLDYIACGTLNEDVLQEVVKGIVTGCEQAECLLSGGETAEMPDMYKKDDFDLAGFCVGLVEKDQMLPKKDEMKEGDILFGLPSSGIHSNGLSLARKALTAEEDQKKLLTPTKIYVKEMKILLETNAILAAAHITGGGLEGNVERVVPPELRLDLTWDWNIPEVFSLIADKGGVEEEEMRKVFNMGIGMVLVSDQERSVDLEARAAAKGIEMVRIGRLVRG